MPQVTRAQVQTFVDTLPFNTLIGVRVTGVYRDGVRLECQLREELKNALGTLHGGLFNTFRYTRFSQNAGGGRYRRHEPLGARGGRRDHDRAGPAAQTALAAVLLNFYFNGWRADTASAIATAKTAQAH